MLYDQSDFRVLDKALGNIDIWGNRLSNARITVSTIRRFGAGMRRLRGFDTGSFSGSIDEANRQRLDRTEFGRLFLEHDGRAVAKWDQYLPAYDEQFQPYRAGFPTESGEVRPLRFLEIGVQHGGSLQLWRKFFGPAAEIWGIDYDDRCQAVDDPDLRVRIGSQNDPEFLRRVVSEMGGVDIVLDDGSHIAKHQRTSLETLFPLLSKGGIYAAEDLHTSYWLDFGGRYGRGGSYIEVVKRVIDDMHGWYHPKRARIPVVAGKTQIDRITVYDSVVFMHKQDRIRPTVLRIGEQSF